MCDDENVLWLAPSIGFVKTQSLAWSAQSHLKKARINNKVFEY